MLAEAKVVTGPDAITSLLSPWKEDLERIGMETGPLAVSLWNALRARNLPVVCLDARQANGVLKMMPNKTDRHDARGLAQIVCTVWFTVLVLAHKRLENGKFAWPKVADGTMKLTPARFSALSEGLDWRGVRAERRPRPTSGGATLTRAAAIALIAPPVNSTWCRWAA